MHTLLIACLLMWLPRAMLAEDVKAVKPIASATSNSNSGRLGPFEIKRHGVAIKSAEELVALTHESKSSADAKVQKEMEAEMAKLLKVDAIDWKKQMVIATIAEKFDSLTTDGKSLTATFIPFKEPLMLGIPPTPKIAVLIERVDGEVKFVQKK